MGEPRDLCYDSAKARRATSPPSKTGKDRLLVSRLDIDHAIGYEPCLREGPGRNRSGRVTPP